jgi:phasin family protein
MADETKANAQAAAEAPAKVADAVAKTAIKVVDESAAAEKRARAAAAARKRRAAAKAAGAKPAIKSPKITATRSAPKRRPVRAAASKVAAATNEGIKTVTNNTNRFFAGFDAIPAFAPFQSMFADAGERSQEAARRTQKVAEELADLTRANVEAFVESSRLAAEGARSLSQDVAASGRQGVEKAADAIRSLAEAKSPTEYLQLQSELARASFDRMVAQSSRLTETVVKLAGEAIQPISNRASANAERINSLVA